MLSNNPIDLKNEEQVTDFESLQEFYLKLLNLLFEDFPCGHIDYMLFLYDHTPLRGSSLGHSCRMIERSWSDSSNFCISVHWTNRVQSRDRLTELIRKMSRHIKGRSFDIRQFNLAYATFYDRRILPIAQAAPPPSDAA